MKRITNFLMLLLLAMCGIGANAQTTVSLDGTSTTGGTFYKGGKYSQGAGVAQTGSAWCCSWVNTGSTPQITLEVRDGTWGNMNSYNANGFAMYRGNNGLVNGNTLYYRLAIANGYRINGIEMQFYNANASYQVTLSCNGVSATATSASASEAATLTVTDLKAQYVDIALTVGANQGCYVPVFNVTYEAADIEYNYSYTQYDATSFTELGSGSGSTTGYSEGYNFTAPSVPSGYALLGVFDATTQAELDLSSTITATNIVLLYSPILTDLANASSSKAYTITSPRGYFYAASADTTQFSSTMTGKADPTNPLHTWTFVTIDGNTYLYNVGANKFASIAAISGHDLVTSAPVTIGGVASTYKSGYPIVMTFALGSNTYYMNMNASGVMIDGWSTHDDGNVLQIVEVPGVTVTPEAYTANFTCTGGSLTSVYVDGTEVALGTDVVLTSGATVSNSATVNAIETYNGYNTLAEALAASNFSGTVDVTMTAAQTDITINVVDGNNNILKTSTLIGAVENQTYDLYTELGISTNFVTLTPSSVTGGSANQTITVTAAYQNLPFTPSTASAPVWQAMSIGNESSWWYSSGTTISNWNGNALPTSTADAYAWAFYGDPINGFVIQNKDTNLYLGGRTASGGALTLVEAANAVKFLPVYNNASTVKWISADYGYYIDRSGGQPYAHTSGQAIYFANLYDVNFAVTSAPITAVTVGNTAVNTGSNVLLASTATVGLAETGLYVMTYDGYATIAEALAADADGVINLAIGVDATVLEPYFTYAGCVNALSEAAATSLTSDYEALIASPTYDNYATLKAQIDANLVQPTEGYYYMQSAFDAYYTQQSVNKAMFYNTSSDAIEWANEDSVAPYVLKLTAVEGATTFNLYAPLADKYLAAKDGSTTTDASGALAFEVNTAKPGAVVLAYNPTGGTDAALHTAGHSSGAGVSGNLTGWTTDSEASMWRLVPVEIEEITLIAPEGVADGDEVMQGFANATDAQLPLNVGVFTITEDLGAGARLDTIATSQIAANQGYIISGVKGATVPLLPVETVDAPAGNLLVAGDGSVVSGGYILAYKKGEAEAKFWPINGLTVPANRSYLPEGAPTRGLENIFGGIGEDVTGINGITTGAENGTVYDLQGRRVNNATKGVYIINGKKVIK